MTARKTKADWQQWYAKLFVDRLQRFYKEGNARVLMQAIAECARHDLPLPHWVADAFLERYDAVERGEVRDWSAAFDRAWAKGAHAGQLSKSKKRAEELKPALFDDHIRSDLRVRLAGSGTPLYSAYAEVLTECGRFGKVTAAQVRKAWEAMSDKDRAALLRFLKKANNT